MNKLEAKSFSTLDVETTLPGKAARGRPRSSACHETILGAVVALLEDEGYGALTIEGVARQAKVGKQTIYRRWRSKAELVLEAYAKHVEALLPIPDRGSLRADLETYLSAVFRRLNRSSGAIMRGLMADAALDAEFGKLMRELFLNKRRQAVRQILERGMTRGELRINADLDLLLDMLFGPLWYRLLSRYGKLDRGFARSLVDALISGFGIKTRAR
jgi:AcrR family transcriptional regulator